MQFGGEPAIEHRVIVNWRLSASSWITQGGSTAPRAMLIWRGTRINFNIKRGALDPPSASMKSRRRRRLDSARNALLGGKRFARTRYPHSGARKNRVVPVCSNYHRMWD